MNTSTALSATEANFERSNDRLYRKDPRILDSYRTAPCKPCDVAAWWSGQVTTGGGAVDAPYIVTFWQIIDENSEDGSLVTEKLEEVLFQMQFEEFFQCYQTLDKLRKLACADGREKYLRRAWGDCQRLVTEPLDFIGFLTNLIYLGEARFRKILQNPITSFRVIPHEIYHEV